MILGGMITFQIIFIFLGRRVLYREIGRKDVKFISFLTFNMSLNQFLQY